MFNKRLALLLPVLFVLSACSGEVVPKDEYNPKLGYETECHQLDQGFKLDGVLDEKEYSLTKHFKGRKTSGDEWADVDWMIHFGTEGIYIGIDVTENTKLYVNPFRSTYINSGIEMYLSPSTATSYSTPNTLEIDMVADGTLLVKRNIGGSSYGKCEIEDVNNPHLVTVMKAEKESEYGYTHELFMPYAFLQKIGFVEENETVKEVEADIVHIASKNYEGNNSSVDRNYYSFANKQLDSGVAWTKPQYTYHFKKDVGFVCHNIAINIEGSGEAYETHGYDFAVPNNAVTITVKPGNGRIASILEASVNGVDCASSIQKTTEEGVYQLVINKDLVTSDLNIKFRFN